LSRQSIDGYSLKVQNQARRGAWFGMGKEKNSGGAHRNVRVTSTSNMVAYWYGQIKDFSEAHT